MADPSYDRTLRRNYRLTVLNGVFIMTAFAFVSPSIILTGFVYKLTGSNVWVGLVSAILGAGWLWPQIFMSNIVEHRERKKPFYWIPGILRVCGWASITAVTFVLGSGDPHRLFVAFLVLFTLYSSAGGISMLPWIDIVGKIIPLEQRARLFGNRRFWGGTLGILAGVLVKYILSDRSGLMFPYNYGALFGLATVFVAASVVAFLLVDEPIEPVSGQRRPFRQHMASGPRLLRHDPDYRKYLVARSLWSLAMMGVPFYVPYAMSRLGAAEHMMGLFLSVTMVSSVLSNLVWRRIGGRSSRIILEWGVALVMVAPLLAVLVPHLPGGQGTILSSSTMDGGSVLDMRTLCLFLVFVVNGAGLAGINLASMTYLLEIAPSRIRPTYIGFMNTFSFPLTFVPVLTGFLIQRVSYEPLFIAAALFGLMGVLVVRRLTEEGVSDEKEAELEQRINGVEDVKRET